MNAADFRRIALSLEGVEEYSHAGLPAFRVGGRKLWFAGGARDFPADSGRLGKAGTHAYSPGGGEQGCTDGRTPNGVETAN